MKTAAWLALAVLLRAKKHTSNADRRATSRRTAGVRYAAMWWCIPDM